MKHRYDLKHTSKVRARAEDKAKKAWNEVKVSENELRPAR